MYQDELDTIEVKSILKKAYPTFTLAHLIREFRKNFWREKKINTFPNWGQKIRIIRLNREKDQKKGFFNFFFRMCYEFFRNAAHLKYLTNSLRICRMYFGLEYLVQI